MSEQRQKHMGTVGAVVVAILAFVGFCAIFCAIDKQACLASCIDYEEMKK